MRVPNCLKYDKNLVPSRRRVALLLLIVVGSIVRANYWAHQDHAAKQARISEAVRAFEKVQATLPTVPIFHVETPTVPTLLMHSAPDSLVGSH